MNRDMEIRIKTANKNFILPHKKNALMTQKDKLVELICEQYTKKFLSPYNKYDINIGNRWHFNKSKHMYYSCHVIHVKHLQTYIYNS